MKPRMKTTPVNGRGSRDDPKPKTGSRTKGIKLKAVRKRKPDQGEEGGARVEEPTGEDNRVEEGAARAGKTDRAGGDGRAEEPIRTAVEEVSILAEPEGAFLQPVRDAIDAVERRYLPLRMAMRGVGTALRSTAVGEFPDMVRKLKADAAPNRKELDKSRTETSKLAILALDQKAEIKRQKEVIRTLEQQDRTTLRVLERLFQPDGEVQTKARLWDERIAGSSTEGAAQVTEVVKEYAAKVEETLKDFRKLIAAVLERCPPVRRPEGGESSRREGGALVASSEVMANLLFSQDAPRAGEIDRMMGARTSTPEPSPLPVRNLDPVLAGDQQEASVARLVNPEEATETSTQPGEGRRPEGGPDGNPDGQPGGARGGAPDGGQIGEQRGEAVGEPSGEQGGEQGGDHGAQGGEPDEGDHRESREPAPVEDKRRRRTGFGKPGARGPRIIPGTPARFFQRPSWRMMARARLGSRNPEFG